MKNSTLILLLAIMVNLSSCIKPKSNSDIPSRYYTDSIYSNYLEEFRKHNVYLPVNFDFEKNYPIIYATDGVTEIDSSDIKLLLDSLINNKIIQPTIFIASHYNDKIADSSYTTSDGKPMYKVYRNFEYVETQYSEGYSDPILANVFENHMLYFKNELIPKVEEKLKIKISSNSRIFYGTSNGAAFGINFLNKNPKTIGTFICFSALGSNVYDLNWDPKINYPKLYIEYGSEEIFLIKDEATETVKHYEESNSFYEIKEFKGGHDHEIWVHELGLILKEVLNDTVR